MALLATRRAPDVPRDATRKVAFFDLEVLTLVLALSVLVLPQHIEAQAIVSLRHVLFALVFFFGWLGVEGAPRRLVVPALAVLGLVHVVNTANLVRGFRNFQSELDDYPSLFDAAGGGERLFKTTYNQESRYVNHGALWHMHFFYAIEKGGISDVQFAEYPHNPIQYKPDMVPPMLPVEFYRSPVWRYFEYVLLRKSSMPPLRPAGDDIEPVSDVADWTLYRVLRSPGSRPPDDSPVARPRREALDSDGGKSVRTPPGGVRHVPPVSDRIPHVIPVPGSLRRIERDLPAGGPGRRDLARPAGRRAR
jgi:hypothetical protein